MTPSNKLSCQFEGHLLKTNGNIAPQSCVIITDVLWWGHVCAPTTPKLSKIEQLRAAISSLFRFMIIAWLFHMLSLYALFIGDEKDKSDSASTVNPPLKELVQFICGHPHLPNCRVLKVCFTRSSLPDAESCFNTLKLPLAHHNYTSFKRAMNIAINCQNQGYGRG